jgi:hypothetical protein
VRETDCHFRRPGSTIFGCEKEERIEDHIRKLFASILQNLVIIAVTGMIRPLLQGENGHRLSNRRPTNLAIFVDYIIQQFQYDTLLNSLAAKSRSTFRTSGWF